MVKLRSAAFSVLLLLAAAAHAGGTAGQSTASTDIPRLGDAVVPASQAVHLRLDAGRPDYSGAVRVDLRARQAADTFRFHAEGQKLTRVALFEGDREIPVRHQAGLPGIGGAAIVTATAAEKLVPGKAYRLEVDFTHTYNTQAVSLYRVQKDGDSYLFSQFQADEARQAFPCWDEPGFKIPYQMTIEAPAAHQVVTNTPVEKETERDGWKTHVFRPTRPMPSYMLAIATGPLEYTPIPGMSVPGRVVTVRGQSHLTGLAVEMTPRLLAATERYFGTRYPYEKLDLLAVPEFWPGAMENPGAITYADRVLLADPQAVSAEQRRNLTRINAHELAHMWFGDLVTMQWWDDFWLNESFADWMGDKITEQVYPELRHALAELGDTHSIMAQDARPSTGPVRRPAANPESAINSVGLSYNKGKAVLSMFEAWLGPEVFRQGVNAYLKKHEWGNATAADLWQALSQASGRDVGAVMAGFLEQPGLPLVSVEALGDNRLRLTQRRFLVAGVEAPAQTWKIPVRLKVSDGVRTSTVEVLLAQPSQTVTVEGVRRIGWVMPNGGAQGYYRWSAPEAMLLEMARRSAEVLDERERVNFVGNLGALLDAGEVRGDTYLRTLTAFANDPEPEVIEGLAAALTRARTMLVLPGEEAAFAAYVRELLGPARDWFGLERRAGEPVAVAFVRPDLIEWLGGEGRDEAVVRHAQELTRRVLAGERVDPALISPSLQVAAAHGDRALYDQFRQRFEAAQVPADRSRYLGALSHFRDPALQEEALRYSLEGPLRPNEVLGVVNGVRTSGGEDRVLQWVHANYDRILAKIPPISQSYLTAIGIGCSTARLEQVQRIFAEPGRSTPAIADQLAKIRDGVMDCARLQRREGAAAAAYLRQVAGATAPGP